MDMHNDKSMAYGEILREITGFRMVIGARQLKKALVSGQAIRVFLAENADPAITDPISDLCQRNSVEIFRAASMADLGRACGIDVGAAAAAAVK